MRSAVLAAAIWFDPELRERTLWATRPLATAIRFGGERLLRWLDQRRDRHDGVQ